MVEKLLTLHKIRTGGETAIENRLGIREKTLFQIGSLTAVFILIMICGSLISEASLSVELDNTFSLPSAEHLFGTDWVGRDMLLRTVKGLGLSMRIGILCAMTSGIIAVFLGVLGPVLGGKADMLVAWLMDLVLSVPHTLVIILISLASGGGLRGIVLGVTLTHWTSLTRVIRAEVIQIKESEYTRVSKQLGKSSWYIAREHVLPHILPQLAVGIVLIFPHAILHEASVTFLGFGLPSHQTAIGIILSESMKYLTSGKWWLAFFPGVSLVFISMLVEKIGVNIEKMLNPKTAYK